MKNAVTIKTKEGKTTIEAKGKAAQRLFVALCDAQGIAVPEHLREKPTAAERPIR